MELDNHKFTGMSRDMHPINQKPEFLWEAHNIRITNREDDTLLSITNEKGNIDSGLKFFGQYLGHCIIDDYLVLFTHSDTLGTYIYRIQKSSNGQLIKIILYNGNDLIKEICSIQAIGIKESDTLVKVYWTDGVTPPKMIIITKPELEELQIVEGNDYTSLWKNGANSFLFIPELQLKETITVTRNIGDGAFSPGTIQYAFSYYNKHGAQSNIFQTTPLYNISHYNRGGNPNDIVGNSFHIEINNVDKFDYLRIYSIHRTSIDATPVVKIAADIKISGDYIQYTDNGGAQQTVDPSLLLYLGASSILAGSIKSVENTLFFGNIADSARYLKDVYYEHESGDMEDFKNYLGSSLIAEDGLREVKIPISYNTNVYKHANQLSHNTSTFKYGEWYRIGLQFQYKDGSWSEPVYRGEHTIKNFSSSEYSEGDQILNLPTFKLPVFKQASQALLKEGYKKVRGVVVFPSFQTRKVLASGMLCPTVFTIGDRLRNNPFSQSSWFFRPTIQSTKDNTKDVENGAFIASDHLSPLAKQNDRGVEIFGSNSKSYDNAIAYMYDQQEGALTTPEQKFISNSTDFYIDQSILTFHSPDIEFGDITDIEGYKYNLELTDLVKLQYNSGDINILTSSPAIGSLDVSSNVYSGYLGFQHVPMESYPKEGKAGRRLCSGLFYSDGIVIKKNRSDEEQELYEYSSHSRFRYMVHPWHKSGSLNNDAVRIAGSGTQSAVLQKKVISNLLYAEGNLDIRTWVAPYKISNIDIFNSDSVSMIKIPGQKISKQEKYNYFGNIDTLLHNDGQVYLTKESGLPFDAPSSNIIPIGSYEGQPGTVLMGEVEQQKNPSIRMKYKSSPHIVLNLNGDIEENKTYILPSVNGYGKCNSKSNPFWLNYDSASSEQPTSMYDKNIFAIVVNNTGKVYEHQEIYKGISTAEGLKVGDFAIQAVNDNGRLFYLLYTAVNTANNSTTWDYVKLTDADRIAGTIYGYWDKQKTSNNVYTYRVDYIGAPYNNHYYYLIDNGTRTFNAESNNTILQEAITVDYSGPYLFLADLCRNESDIQNPFGGNTDKALQDNVWIPASDDYSLDGTNTVEVEFKYGDTWYQRYDCLKTHPFTNEDENQVIEIASFMCESRINIDGRYDRNRGQKSNLSMSPQNFNLINKAYSQKNSFFRYFILDESFYKTNKFPTQINWSMEKSPGEDIDTWTHIIPSSKMYLDGIYGQINSIQTFNDSILAFQDNAISIINFNTRVQIPTSDGVPIEIQNSYKVDGYKVLYSNIGCQDQSSVINTKNGIYFIDSIRKNLMLFDGKQVNNISDALGMRQWFTDNINNYKWSPFKGSNNGIKLFYDDLHGDLYISPGPQSTQKNALCYSDSLRCFTSTMSYGGILSFERFKDIVLSFKDNDSEQLTLWQQFKGDYNKLYDHYYPFYISFISNKDAIISKIFDTIEYRADMYDEDTLLHNDTFNYIQVENEYQNTTIRRDTDIVNKWNPIKKFRVWRGQIPRDQKNLQEGKRAKTRICNPWTRITLGYDKENSNKMILHDVVVKYTV